MENFNANYGIPFSSICRTCLNTKEDMRPVHEASIADMLMYSASVQVVHGDGMPNFICLQCLRQINRSYSFKQLCEKSDAILRQYVLDGFLPTQLQDQSDMHIEKIDIPGCDASAKYLRQQELILTTFDDENDLLRPSESFAKLSQQQSEDEDTTGFIDCPELDLEPECNLVENALAALQEDLERRDEIPDTEESQWFQQDDLLKNSKSDGSDFSKLTKSSSSTAHFKNKSAAQLYRKNVIDASEKKHHCLQCTEGFTNAHDLSVHMSTHPTDGNIKCCICNKQFIRMRMLKRHIKIHMSWKAYKCHICSKEFTESGSLNKHIKRHEGLVKEKNHVCVTCGKGYQDSYYLAIHMRKHTGEKPFSCEHCTKSFSDQRLLASHIKSHNQDKSHQCMFCSKSFTHSSTLTTHLRTHTGEKPYICKICGKKFIQSSNLSLHMRTHTGVKPYFCGICNKSFASSSTLTYHSRTHTGEKPYLCSVCGKSFARSEDVTLHMRTHTGEKPFQCPTCQKKFTTSSHRNQHMLIHSGEKPHLCRICNKGCTSLAQIRQHMLKAHGETIENSSKNKETNDIKPIVPTNDTDKEEKL